MPVPAYEPPGRHPSTGLEELIRKNVRERRLSFTTDLPEAVGPSQVVFIAVGTPEGENGDADLKHVLAAVEQTGRALRRYTVVVDKSTVPVGTADKVREVILKVTDVEFDVVSNPEFLKEGAALEDFLKPDRVVLGTDSERARKVMGQLYAPFVRTENPILYMDTRSAELTTEARLGRPAEAYLQGGCAAVRALWSAEEGGGVPDAPPPRCSRCLCT